MAGLKRHFMAALPAILSALFLRAPAAAEETLYQRLGGQTGIVRIVDAAYAVILSDDRVKDDFDNINIDHIKLRIEELICQLTKGPCVYHGRPMGPAHEGLYLTRAKFNAVAEDLQTGMAQVGIPYWTQNQLMALLAPMQREIVTR
jgi:hemoglobin